MTKYEEELQAWKDFELDCLIEEQEKPIQVIDWDDPDIWDIESGLDIGRNSDYVSVDLDEEYQKLLDEL